MDDLISRKEAIDELRKFKPEIIPYEKARIYVKETVKTMYDRIVELPTIQPEPKWIPVSERLPEIGGEYLVSVRWYREDDIDIDVYDYDARCKEWNDGESCGQRVIAWMPLPVVYKPNK